MSKRPMLIITVSYIIGIILGLYLEISIALFVLTGICILFGILLFILVNKRSNISNILNFKTISLCIIFIMVSTSIVLFKEQKFKTLYEGINDDVKFLGTVVSVQKESQYYFNYIVKIKDINNNDKYKNTNILLKIKKNRYSQYKSYEYGDLIFGIGNFEKPSNRRNYKGYDYSQYLKTKNVYMICNSNSNDIKLVQKNSQFVTNMWISRLKNKLKSNLYRLVSKDTADIAVALLLGDSSLIESEQKQVFSDASLSHILAVSGMHVTYFILGCSLILKKFDKRKSKYILIICIIFFAQLTGASPSVVRVVIMSGIMIAAKLVYRKSDTLNNIALSCLIILIINPYNILNLGFQLSFLGTLGIVLFNKKIKEMVEKISFVSSVNDFANNSIATINDKLKSKNIKTLIKKFIAKIISICMSIVIISVSANLLIFPILIYTYNTASFTFVISNILVAPILGVMCCVGYLTLIISLISMKLAGLVSVLMEICIRIFKFIAKFSSDLSIIRFTVTTPSVFSIICYYALIIYLFYFYKVKYKRVIIKLCTVSVIVVILCQSIIIANTGTKIHFIDVGQGDSTLVITSENKRILIDGGGSETGSYDVGENTLVPYLLDRKVKTIDYMIFSHFDSDHCKGLFTVMDKLNVKNVVISEQGDISENYKQFLQMVKSKKINLIYVKARK